MKVPSPPLTYTICQVTTLQILETQSAVLTNYEVLTHLQEVQSRYATHPDYDKRTTAKLHNLQIIVHDLTAYLTTPPSPLAAAVPATTAAPSSSSSPSTSTSYTPASITTLITRLRKYNLTKPELLMLFNLRPESEEALGVVVEEADMRFSGVEMAEIVQIVRAVLGGCGG